MARRRGREELVVDLLVDDHRSQRRAALARGAEAAEQRALDGEVEVGVGHDDERVLAAELQAGRLEVAAAELTDPPADIGGIGEAHLVNHILVQRALEPNLFDRPRRAPGGKRERIAVRPRSKLVPERDVVFPPGQRRHQCPQVGADATGGPAGPIQDGDAHGSSEAARRSAPMVWDTSNRRA